MPELTIGPIDYLVLEFPGARFDGEGLTVLADLVDRGLVHVLDLRFVRREPDGAFTAVALRDLDGDGILDLAVLKGVESGLLDEDDLGKVAAITRPGHAAALLVYENTWAAPFVSAMRHAGAELIASGRIPAGAVIETLEEIDAIRFQDATMPTGGM